MSIKLKCLSHTPLRGLNDPGADVVREVDAVQAKLRAEVEAFDIEEISKAAGRSTHEIRTWVAAFAALAASGVYEARKDYYRPINEWIAGYGVVSAEVK